MAVPAAWFESITWVAQPTFLIGFCDGELCSQKCWSSWWVAGWPPVASLARHDTKLGIILFEMIFLPHSGHLTNVLDCFIWVLGGQTRRQFRKIGWRRDHFWSPKNSQFPQFPEDWSFPNSANVCWLPTWLHWEQKLPRKAPHTKPTWIWTDELSFSYQRGGLNNPNREATAQQCVWCCEFRLSKTFGSR